MAKSDSAVCINSLGLTPPCLFSPSSPFSTQVLQARPPPPRPQLHHPPPLHTLSFRYDVMFTQFEEYDAMVITVLCVCQKIRAARMLGQLNSIHTHLRVLSWCTFIQPREYIDRSHTPSASAASSTTDPSSLLSTASACCCCSSSESGSQSESSSLSEIV